METQKATPSLAEALDRLGRRTAVRFPVLSLYLNAQPDNRGKDNYAAFLRKELRGRVKDFELRSPERESFEQDVARIERYVSEEVRPSANGIALFACSAADFFEALQLDAPIERHRLTVGDRPHLYPLARIVDRYPRHAVVLANTNHARIYVFGRGRTIDREELASEKVSRTEVGGWSQLRYQRHVEDHYLHHAKEVVEALRRIVAEDRAEYVFLAGDDVIVPLLQDELPKGLERKIVGVLRLDIRSREDEVRAAASEALTEYVAARQREEVDRLRGELRAGGLAVAGVREVLEALEKGRADEVWLTTAVAETKPAGSRGSVPLGDEIVQRTLATRARVSFAENPDLLADLGGIVASLRYRPGATSRASSPVERKVEA